MHVRRAKQCVRLQDVVRAAAATHNVARVAESRVAAKEDKHTRKKELGAPANDSKPPRSFSVSSNPNSSQWVSLEDLPAVSRKPPKLHVSVTHGTQPSCAVANPVHLLGCTKGTQEQKPACLRACMCVCTRARACVCVHMMVAVCNPFTCTCQPVRHLHRSQRANTKK